MNKPLAFTSDREFFQTLSKLPNKHTPKVATRAASEPTHPRPSSLRDLDKWRS